MRTEDFGHLVSRTPHSVRRAEHPAQVVEAIAFARAAGLPLAPRGAAHSVYGRSQAEGGVVLDVTGIAAVGEVTPDRVTVGAGASWRAVVEATLPAGLAPPVLPDYLDLTVGGTVVVGGVGGTTHRHGLVSDNVLELEVVTGTGDVVVCGPGHPLFDAARGGLGQVGVVTSVTLALAPAPPQARRYVVEYRTLEDMVADSRALLAENRWDYLQGAVLPTPDGWRPVLEGAALVTGTHQDVIEGLNGVVEITTMSHRELLSRLEPLEAALRELGQWDNPHPWLTTFVPDAAVEDVVGKILDRTPPEDLGKFGRVVVSPIAEGAVRTPLVRVPEGHHHAVNVLRFPGADPDEAERLVAVNRELYEVVVRAGGTLYPVSALPLSAAEWAAHYGDAMAGFAAARAEFDPDGILTPGYEVFR
ncbi:FAD-binding protein [Actinokineospora bangkokensis]|uniref:FAD-binding protein n=1 Tax=Actinokineospora bangkokensis TaxID=1193682 RepID=UPI000AFE59C5|nr:FAD-binding protein [Actinokineospora bangkokensis]